MRTIIKEPKDCSEQEIKNFEVLVIECGQVDQTGLQDRIKRASLLAFRYDENKLVGIAAIKRPNRTYVAGVFEKAQKPRKINDYQHELGWVCILPKYRRQGIGGELVEKLLESFRDHNLFATTKTDNKPMQNILEEYGFQRSGHPYKGREKYELQLYLRTKTESY